MFADQNIVIPESQTVCWESLQTDNYIWEGHITIKDETREFQPENCIDYVIPSIHFRLTIVQLPHYLYWEMVELE